MLTLSSFLYQLLVWTGITFAAFRLTRLVTTDTFPPIKHLRDRIYPPNQKTDPRWYQELITCNWCAGAYLTLATLLVTDHFLLIRFPILCYFVAWSLVGIIGDNHA